MVMKLTMIHPIDMTAGPPTVKPYSKRVVIPVMTLYGPDYISTSPWSFSVGDVEARDCNAVSERRRAARGFLELTMMENETPKLCINVQSRLSSCLYPSSAKRASSLDWVVWTCSISSIATMQPDSGFRQG
jgi:hypothetical protein